MSKFAQDLAIAPNTRKVIVLTDQEYTRALAKCQKLGLAEVRTTLRMNGVTFSKIVRVKPDHLALYISWNDTEDKLKPEDVIGVHFNDEHRG